MASNKRPITIGSYTNIDLPKFGISKVAAKVDTGADSSSIWASSIKENNGHLTYVLFGPSSTHYTGKEITTTNFQISLVKNSFGYSEFRYKVPIKTSIEGRNINIWYTLANRKNNSYSVLIGRKTLHSRFLVDVSRVKKRQFNVLIMKPNKLKKGGKYAAFFDQMQEQNPALNFTFATYKDLSFVFSKNRLKVQIDGLGKDASDFDMVYFLLVSNYQYVASALALYLKSRNVTFVDKAILNYHQSLNKLHQCILLQTNGVRVPAGVFMDHQKLADSYGYLAETLGSPFIIKDINSHRGEENYLVKSSAELKKLVAKAANSQFIAQKYIPNDGDYRILVHGKQIKMVIKRTAKAGSHLNNVSADGQAAMVSLANIPASVKRTAIKVGELLQIDISGVDMLKDKQSGLWYCLEVNENPSLVTGAFPEQKQKIVADYLTKRLHKI
ncbi:MAG TPA: RimK/LysX family protein [Candidatus Binatia bacterium]|nr:RimK/LysX family protein [Candidatus Binatia bacterium]